MQQQYDSIESSQLVKNIYGWKNKQTNKTNRDWLGLLFISDGDFKI